MAIITNKLERMPALYLSHGAPPLLEDQEWMEQLAAWSSGLPKPKAILIVSAHWDQAPMMLSATQANTDVIYDFGGFAERYFRMRYDTPDATALAQQVAALMPDDEPLYQHPTRGLDHGAWVPLSVMYPAADVPVLQLSMPTHDPERLLTLGRRLQPLRDEGVLIIGSGFMTHGLPFVRDYRPEAEAPGWSAEFDAWAAEALARGDVDTLADYGKAPGMPYAHSTVDHYTPLFVTLGASSDPEQAPEQVIEGFWIGLSKRSFQVA